MTFEFGHDIAILKMVISDKVNYIELEAALMCGKVDGGRHYRRRKTRLSTSKTNMCTNNYDHNDGTYQN